VSALPFLTVRKRLQGIAFSGVLRISAWSGSRRLRRRVIEFTTFCYATSITLRRSENATEERRWFI